MTRILIIGGGVGGLAVALALHKAGAEPVVYEAHPDSKARRAGPPARRPGSCRRSWHAGSTGPLRSEAVPS
jgi:2-polyprenyl-6-methoxyphenol hydroxylase-like FAD-dependent oxidoreductase